MTPFSGLSSTKATIGAKYSMQTMSYIWIKAYYPYQCCSSTIKLNQAEDTLAILVLDSTKFYIYIIDPQTGIEKYNYLTVTPNT